MPATQDDTSLTTPAATGRKLYHAGTLTYTTGGLVALFGYLLAGDLVWQIKDRSVTDMVKLLLRQFHATDFLVSVLLVAVPQVIGISMGPYISYASDRFRSRWGRRIPFLLVSTPLAGLAIICLAFAPGLGQRLAHLAGGSGTALDFWVLLFFGLFWVFFDITTTVANSVFSAFINDVVPQATMGRFYGMFRVISLMAGIVFMGWLFGQTSQYYFPIFLGVGLLYGVGFPLTCMRVKEGSYPPPPQGNRPLSPVAFFWRFGRDCFRIPYYRWVFAAIILPNLALLPINTFNLYYAQQVGMSTDQFGKLTALFFFISLLLAFPLGWLSDRFHPLRVAMVALGLHGAASLWGGIYIHDIRSFALTFVTTGVLAGTWLTATAPLAPRLLPRLNFAQYACALGITNSVLNMLFAPLMGYVLHHTDHEYRLIYLAAFALDVAGLLVTAVLLRKFLALGGEKSYVAPE